MERTVVAAVLFSAVLAGPVVAHARDVAPPPPGEDRDLSTMARKIRLQVKARTLTAVPENDPGPIALDLIQVQGIPPSLTEGVEATGYTRHVVVDDRIIGQMVISAVSGRGRTEPLDTEQFTGQFDLPDPVLAPDRPVQLEGDQQQLLAALQRLQGGDTPAPAPEADRDDAVKRPSQHGTGTGGKGATNADAANWKTPDALKIEEKEKTFSSETVNDGCPVRVDIPQLVAIQQSKVVTINDGERTESACEDGNDRFPLHRSTSACSDVVDADKGTAVPQYQLYYVDKGGTRHQASDCRPDPDKAYAITEDFGSCQVFVDYARKTVSPQSQLVYTNGSNARTVVRGCQASKTRAAVPLVETAEGCTIRHDFAAGRSFQQVRNQYVMDGRTWLVGPCADGSTSWNHIKAFDDNGGRRLCTPLVDRTGRTVTEQYQIRISGHGREDLITPCTPEKTARLETTDSGCENPVSWVHDLAAGVSYPKTREFYRRPNGTIEYLSECKVGSKSLIHQVETVGWQHDDKQHTSLPLQTVTIPADGSTFVVARAQVLPGTSRISWIEKETLTEPTAERTYEGCNEIVQTRKIRVWTRPDGTLFREDTGPGEPLPPRDACVSSIERKTEYSRSVVSGNSGSLDRFGLGEIRFNGGHKVSLTTGPFGACGPDCRLDDPHGCSGYITGHNYERTMVRTVRKLADGTTFTGPWVQESEQGTAPFTCRIFIPSKITPHQHDH